MVNSSSVAVASPSSSIALFLPSVFDVMRSCCERSFVDPGVKDWDKGVIEGVINAV